MSSSSLESVLKCAHCNKTTDELDEGQKLSRCVSCKVAHYCSREHQSSNWKVHKPACASVTTSKPFFVHIDFERQTTDNAPWCKPFLDSISLPFSRTFYVATSSSAALSVLAHPIKPRSILLTSGEVASRSNAPLRAQLRSYIEGGGTVILGGPMASFLEGDKFDPLFADLGAPEWQRAGYHRTTHYLNVAHPLFADLPSESVIRGALPSSYSCKSVFLKNVPVDQALYQTDSRSQFEGLVPGLPGSVPVSGECAVAAKKVGKGVLAYAGDVNQENGTTTVSLWLLGVKE